MQSVNLRNLEEIQERDEPRVRARLATLLFAAIGCGTLVVASVIGLGKTSSTGRAKAVDPLVSLSLAQRSPATAPEDLGNTPVRFPSVLSDAQQPTTALAAVKDPRGRLVAKAPELDPVQAVTASSAEGLASPRPAGELLRATSVTTEPKDELVRIALSANQTSNDGPAAPEGHDGGFQIQVASFRSADDADAFAQDLRKRQHQAYRQAAYVPDRGLWHRVRIGPFKTKFEATMYKNKLERAERIAGFVVDPDRQKRPVVDRESGLSNRESKKPAPPLMPGT